MPGPARPRHQLRRAPRADRRRHRAVRRPGRPGERHRQRRLRVLLAGLVPPRRCTRPWCGPSSRALAEGAASPRNASGGADMKTLAAIVGPGNIGTDLLAKLQRSERRRRRATWSASIESDGLARARDAGRRRLGGGRRLAAAPGPAAATSSSRPPRPRRTAANAPRYAEAGHHRHRPDPGRHRAVGLPAGERARAPRRAEHQHDHLRRPGDDPDRARGVVG